MSLLNAAANALFNGRQPEPIDWEAKRLADEQFVATRKDAEKAKMKALDATSHQADDTPEQAL